MIECGRDVAFIEKGDLVSVPFNIACGRCRNCRERNTQICLNVNPEQAGGAYGYAGMDGWIGGQAGRGKWSSPHVPAIHRFTRGRPPHDRRGEAKSREIGQSMNVAIVDNLSTFAHMDGAWKDCAGFVIEGFHVGDVRASDQAVAEAAVSAL